MILTPERVPFGFRVWRRNFTVFKKFALAEVGPLFVEPLVVLGAMGLGLGAYVTLSGDTSYVQFIGPGIIGGYSLFAAFFECTYGSYTRMAIRGLYEAMISTPLSIEDVITGEVLWGATRSLFSATVILFVLSLMGFVDSPLAIFIPPLAFLGGILFSSMALLVTAHAPSFWTFNYAITMGVMPMYFFGGVFFPLERYPDIVREVAWIIPLTPYVAVVRELVTGNLSMTSVYSLLYLTVLGIGFYYLAVARMKARLIR